MEPAAIHIEMNITLFKIGRAGLPDFHFRVQRFDCLPCRVTNPLAVNTGCHKETLQIPPGSFHLDDYTADLFAVMDNPIRSTSIYRRFNGLPGDDYSRSPTRRN